LYIIKKLKRSLLITLLSPLSIGLLIDALPAETVGLEAAQLGELNRSQPDHCSKPELQRQVGLLTEGATGAKVRATAAIERKRV